ncbi:MAG: PAS domain S-box protein [Yoonia sp.]|nr:PAS domain S-box protein [Yoonia sp.]
MARTTPKTVATTKATAKTEVTIPIVGIGASAGGLQAFSDFFDAAPISSGVGYVLVHHVDPDHKSLMADLLAKHTTMPVVLAVDQLRVKADHVYVIPPKKYLEIKGGVLHLTEPTERRGARLPIDLFFKSLAKDLGQNAVAVILSGSGSDGAASIREIKEQGGIVLVQDPIEAQHDGMPRSAIATGAVDHVVSVPQMPEIITNYIRHPFIQSGGEQKETVGNAKGVLDQIIAVLKKHSPINFELYKDGTMLRRIERRMALKHMENPSDYLALLRDSREEAQNLCADLLISVTSFFRDPDAFEYLDKSFLGELVKSHDKKQPIRIWVPGCATGEEAYTLAMLVIEKISTLGKDVKLQIFASDVDERALKIAREGVYPDSISENVSAARLRRFFTKEDHSYRVTPELRDTVVFAQQNILADAPFSKLDLVSCRNVLIYLTPNAQERVLQMFHFALNDGGTLFLGTSETTGSHDELFLPLSKKYRIYKRVANIRNRAFDFPLAQRPFANSSDVASRSQAQITGDRLAELSQSLLVARYAPAAVLINVNSETLYFDGPTDNYLRVPSGESSRDLLAMAREGLRTRLRIAIRTARSGAVDVKESATITRGNEKVNVIIQVHPVKLDEAEMFLVTFVDQPATRPSLDVAPPNGHLEQELEATRADLRNTVRDYERSTEELKAVNEEAMSMNEEFQSTNEELETSKEELQSLNEELTTLNSQLQQKIDDERRVSDDLNNLLASSGIATIFLDSNLKIMRFTPATRELFNLISNDMGRSFSDITGKFKDSDLLVDAKTVLETLATTEREVESTDGRWFIRRVLPYCTQDGKVGGVVVTFADVTKLKELQRLTAVARQYAEKIVDTLREPLLVLDGAFNIISVSQSFHRVFVAGSEQLVGQNLFTIQNRQWDEPKLRDLLGNILRQKKAVESFELTLDTPNVGQRDMVMNARMIEDGQDFILLALEDVTEQKKAHQEILNREARLSAILNAAPEAIVTINEAGIIGSFSTGAEEILGFKADEVIGQNVNILMPEPNHSGHDGYLEHYVKTGEKKIIGMGREMDACHKDGTRVPIRLTVSEMVLDGTRHFLGIMHDLTTDRKRQVELQRAQKMEAVGQLTGGLAHDFNNLLTVVIGNLELLEMRTDDPKLLELMHGALEASNIGAALTSQLLSFSKSQALEPENVALNDLVKTMLSILERTLDGQIVVETRLGDDLAETLADPGQVESAILNLAINARNAMPNGGTLTIETRNVTLDADFAATQVDVTPGDYVCLAMTDTGVGIDPEIQARVFEPFFTTKGPGAGSGLGLSMVYGFAKQSGGHVSIYSEAGQGTTVNLFLPKAASKKKDQKNERLEQPTQASGETILVVEDDPKVLRLTVTRLKQLNYQVIAATNGPEAIKILTENKKIDLVLSDVVMPGGMSGFDVAAKAMALRPDLKIILSTGYAKGIEPHDATSGMVKHKVLRKPYGLQELARSLRELLD